jgi:hypothetical protein
MKVIVKKKKKLLYGKSESKVGKSSSGGVAPWAVTDPNKFKALADRSRKEGNRPPEFWVKSGDRHRVRFVDPEPIASFTVYTVNRNGRFNRYIAPAEGEIDMFQSHLNLRPQQVFLYRLIDIDGYTDKNGKKKTHLPRFYVVGARIYEQLSQISEMTGSDLNETDMIVARSGEKQNTVYSFIPRPAPKTSKVIQAIREFPKWQELYAPPTAKEQRALVASMGADTDDDDER